MPLPTRVRTRLIDSINVMFRSIGSANVVELPNFTTDSAKIAWEYWRTKHIRDLAIGQYEKAKKDAERSGVIFDSDKHPREPGRYNDIYKDDQVVVNLLVRYPSSKVDVKKLYTYLAGKGIKTKTLDEAVQYATTVGKAAHVFEVSLDVEPTEETKFDITVSEVTSK